MNIENERFNDAVKLARRNSVKKDARDRKWLKPTKDHKVSTIENLENSQLLNNKVVEDLKNLILQKIDYSGYSVVIYKPEIINIIYKNNVDGLDEKSKEKLLNMPLNDSILLIFTKLGFYSSYDNKYKKYRVNTDFKGYMKQTINYYYFESKFHSLILFMTLWVPTSLLICTLFYK